MMRRHGRSVPAVLELKPGAARDRAVVTDGQRFPMRLRLWLRNTADR